MKVAITGATGFIGNCLVERLQAQGHQPLILTRNRDAALRAFPTLEVVAYTPTESGSWQQAIAGCDAVVNLAGASIAERWTPKHKQEILDSRQLGTRKIVEAIAQANPKPTVLVNTSAIGYYGTSETATFDETSPSGNDYLAEVCQAWEAEAQNVKEAGVRLVILRFGVVLGKSGGALAKMIPPFQLFAGGPLGSGRQWVSWIHRDDLVNLIMEALTRTDIEGVLNATAPNPVRMSEFAQTLGDVLNRPSWLPVPDFVPELLLGEGAKVVVEGQEVLPKRTIGKGFNYQYPTLKQALAQIVASS